MRGTRTAGVAVGLAAVVLGGAALFGGDDVVAGTPRPSGDARKLVLLRSCEFEDVDLSTVTLGPLIRDSNGELLVLATEPDGTVLVCSPSGAGVLGPYDIPPEEKVRDLGSSYNTGSSGFTGYGYAAPGVARVEIELPDGQVIDAVPEGGTFAYTADGEPPSELTLRAYDESGALLQDR